MDIKVPHKLPYDGEVKYEPIESANGLKGYHFWIDRTYARYQQPGTKLECGRLWGITEEQAKWIAYVMGNGIGNAVLDYAYYLRQQQQNGK